MAKIVIIKKSDGYAYKYDIINEKNKIVYITKSGYKTQEEALNEARKSYNRRMNKPNPIHVEKNKHKKTKENKEFKIKNLKIDDDNCMVLGTAVCGIVLLTFVFGFMKLAEETKSKFPDNPENHITDIYSTQKQIITASDCDYSNIYVILRTAENETNGVSAVTSDMLTRLGISNETVSKDSDLSEKVSNAISNNPNSSIVVINLESGLENYSEGNTIIMGDCSNKRKYSSDVLAACIAASLNEYNLGPTIKSGQLKSGGWRLPSYIEEYLTNASLINNVSQLTIDLPTTVGSDEITRNDAAASIVEGIMRWTTLDVNKRYKEIYYTAEYGDTIVSVGQEYGVSSVFIEDNSDLNLPKGIKVGDTLTIGYIPSVASENVTVYNPYTTTNYDDVQTVINEYTVEAGDTLTKIANMYGVKVEDIITASGDPNNIQIGEKLYIPTSNLYLTNEKEYINQNTI